jgi:hypothetical protein
MCPDYEALIVKLDSLGNVQWLRSYGTEDKMEKVKDAAATTDGGWILFGEQSPKNDPASSRLWLAKIDEVGNLQLRNSTSRDCFQARLPFSRLRTEGFWPGQPLIRLAAVL